MSGLPGTTPARKRSPGAAAAVPAKAPLAPARGAGSIRIIGGQWKRTVLPVADTPGLRPTPDRVRETLFNWLGQDLAGWHCADPFAGSGALGLEAASRGAAKVLMVEQHLPLVRRLEAIKQRLQASAVTLERGDGVAALRRQAPASLDLVLLDPPFDSPAYEAALKAASQAVRPEGFVYLEASKLWDEADLAALNLRVYRYLKAGAVHAHLLQRAA